MKIQLIILSVSIFSVLAIVVFYYFNRKESFENIDSSYVIDIAAGANHSVFLNQYGKIYPCGKNDNGRLGTGNNVSVMLPFSLENNIDIYKIYAGNVNTFFLTKENALYATGENTNGQLGIGTLSNQFAPVPIDFFKSQNIKIKKVSAGWYHTLFLTTTNDVYVCGSNNYGQLATGNNEDTRTPVKLSLQCKDIASGQGHSVFLTTHNKVYTSGWNWYGQLGNNDTTNKNIPTEIEIQNIINVYAGMTHSVLLDSQGKVYVCGNNIIGQLGLSKNIRDQRSFALLNTLPSGIINVSTGQSHTLFLSTDGDLYACGSNVKGQLGLSHNNNIYKPEHISFFDGNVSKMAAGSNHSVFLTKEGNVYACGDNNMGGQLAIKDMSQTNIPLLCDIPIELETPVLYNEAVTGIQPVMETANNGFKVATFVQKDVQDTFSTWINGITSNARSAQITNPGFSLNATLITGYAGGVVLKDGRVVLIPLKNTRVAIYNPTNSTISYCANNISGGYFGGVLLKDGRVFLANHHPNKPAIYDPVLNTLSSNSIGNGGKYYRGCVLLNDGRVLCVPQNDNTIGIYDPNITPNTFIKITYSGNSVSCKWAGGVLLPNGSVLFVPRNSNAIGIYDPTKSTPFTLVESPNLPNGGNKYETGCLLPDGRVIFTPLDSNNIGIYDPLTKIFKTESHQELQSGGGKYHGCVTLPDGRVLFVPWAGRNIGIYTPSLNGGKGSFTRYFINNVPVTYVGATLMQNGRVLMIPYDAPRLGIISGFPSVSIDRCTHPVFNKY